MFQIKDLMVDILPGRGVLLGPNCRISATDPGMPCGPRSVRPRPTRPHHPAPKTPNPPHPLATEPPTEPATGPLSAACGHERENDADHRAAGLGALRRELRAALAPR